MSNLLVKLRFDRHHLMERFGVMFLVLVLAMSALVTSIGIQKVRADRESFMTGYLYTSTFKSSLTGTSGSVVNMYRNSAGTKAFLLLQFDNTAGISTDANTYQLLLCGSDTNGDHETLLSVPVASIYMMGNTGYFGVYLIDNGGFHNQIMRCIVRMNRRLSGSTEAGTEVGTIESTFQEHDQFDVYFNPVGGNAPVADFLDNEGKVSISDLYALAVSNAKEQEAREKLSADLQGLEQQLLYIKEYEERLTRDGIQLPERPELIRDDRVEVQFDGQVIQMTARENYVYPEGHPNAGAIIPDDQLVRYLRTDHIFSGGYDFDWYNGSIQTGYLHDLIGEQTVGEYLNAQHVLQNKNEASLQVSDIKWYYADGTEFVYNSNVDPASIAAINSNIQTLMDAWKSYASAKLVYQTTDLEELLKIERDYLEIADSYTINSDSSNLWCF